MPLTPQQQQQEIQKLEKYLKNKNLPTHINLDIEKIDTNNFYSCLKISNIKASPSSETLRYFYPLGMNLFKIGDPLGNCGKDEYTEEEVYHALPQ